MKKLAAFTALFVTLLVGVAVGFPPLTVENVTDKSVTLANLDCNTRYEFRVRERRNGAWRDSTVIERTTNACPLPPPPPSGPPTAAFTFSPANPNTGQQVAFNGTGSTCPATPCTYTWEDDGSDGPGGTQWALGTGQSLNFTFQNAGTKHVRLTVADSQARTATVQHDVVVGSPPPPPPPPPPTGDCDLNATTSNFAAQVSAATAGQVLCLATGNYGTWGGTTKAITITDQEGATPQLRTAFGSGAANFTLDDLQIAGGSIDNPANHITIRNSQFTNSIWIRVTNSDILFDNNTHNNLSSSLGSSARIFMPTNGPQLSGVTVRNSLFSGSDMDGIETGIGLNIINNRFINLCNAGTNHTDAIQFYGHSVGAVIRGNYVYANCGTQGIASFDEGTESTLIEDNVVDIPRPWGIEWYSDVNSIIRHNTVVYHPASYCDFNQACGKISLTAQPQDTVGVGTQVYDNLAQVEIDPAHASTARNDHNVYGNGAVFVGPTPLDAYADYYLAAGSIGKGAASDGLDVGIR